MNYVEGRHEGHDAQRRAEGPLPYGSKGEAKGAVREQKPQPIRGSANAKDVGASFCLRYEWEPFRNIAKELPPLFKRHWKEIALNQEQVSLDPDWPRYFDYDLLGILRCLTVRDGPTLVGYVFVLVFPHLHYASTLWAQTDIFWLDPSYRQGWTGYRMLRLMEKRLKETGVKVIYANAKLHFEASRGTIGKLLERLGYKPTEMLYSKFIG